MGPCTNGALLCKHPWAFVSDGISMYFYSIHYCRLYTMQKNAKEEPSPVLKLMHAEPNLVSVLWNSLWNISMALTCIPSHTANQAIRSRVRVGIIRSSRAAVHHWEHTVQQNRREVKWLLSWLLHKWTRRLSVTNSTFWLNTPAVVRVKQKSFTLMTTGVIGRNVGKLFSKLKLVTDNLLLGETILISMVATPHDPHMICTLYCTHSEILRYFITKGGDKAKSAPNLTAIFDHFNRVSHGGVLCVCIGRGNIDLPPSFPPSNLRCPCSSCGVWHPSTIWLNGPRSLNFSFPSLESACNWTILALSCKSCLQFNMGPSAGSRWPGNVSLKTWVIFMWCHA